MYPLYRSGEHIRMPFGSVDKHRYAAHLSLPSLTTLEPPLVVDVKSAVFRGEVVSLNIEDIRCSVWLSSVDCSSAYSQDGGGDKGSGDLHVVRERWSREKEGTT